MIAIKDMEMPKNCGSCVMRVGKCKERIYMENRPDRCPLIEIKTDGDTISRQAAIDALIEWYGCEPNDMDYFAEILAKQPSAQPEIVRCKDCKHRYTDECPMRYTEWVERDEYGEYELRDIVHDYTEDEKFCSEGERRTDGQSDITSGGD